LSFVTVITRLQYDCNWVELAAPSVQATPILYAPFGISPGENTLKLNAGIPEMPPAVDGATAISVSLFTIGVPLVSNKG